MCIAPLLNKVFPEDVPVKFKKLTLITRNLLINRGQCIQLDKYDGEPIYERIFTMEFSEAERLLREFAENPRASAPKLHPGTFIIALNDGLILYIVIEMLAIEVKRKMKLYDTREMIVVPFYNEPSHATVRAAKADEIERYWPPRPSDPVVAVNTDPNASKGAVKPISEIKLHNRVAIREQKIVNLPVSAIFDAQHPVISIFSALKDSEFAPIALSNVF